MRVDKRGIQRPVEMFFVLFVITASVLLTTQIIITDVTTQQPTVHDEQYQRELIEEAASYCQTQCTQASRDDCSLRSLARLCVSYASDTLPENAYLDLNRNDEKDTDTTQLAGIGICEGNVPCHTITSSCCGQPIDASSCETILRDYWEEQGITNKSAQDNKFKEQWIGGQCEPSETMWWDQTNTSVCTGSSCQTAGIQ